MQHLAVRPRRIFCRCVGGGLDNHQMIATLPSDVASAHTDQRVRRTPSELIGLCFSNHLISTATQIIAWSWGTSLGFPQLSDDHWLGIKIFGPDGLAWMRVRWARLSGSRAA